MTLAPMRRQSCSPPRPPLMLLRKSLLNFPHVLRLNDSCSLVTSLVLMLALALGLALASALGLGLGLGLSLK